MYYSLVFMAYVYCSFSFADIFTAFTFARSYADVFMFHVYCSFSHADIFSSNIAVTKKRNN